VSPSHIPLYYSHGRTSNDKSHSPYIQQWPAFTRLTPAPHWPARTTGPGGMSDFLVGMQPCIRTTEPRRLHHVTSHSSYIAPSLVDGPMLVDEDP
jgi:hypothetical protein